MTDDKRIAAMKELDAILAKRTEPRYEGPIDIDNKEALMASGFIARSDIPHPMGGDYTEAHYLGVDHKYTTPDNAVTVIVRAFTNDGKLVHSDIMYREEAQKEKRRSK